MKIKLHRMMKNNKDTYEVCVTKNSQTGQLKCTNEIFIWFVKENNTWMFQGAWYIGVSESYYNESEINMFEQTFPGLINQVKNQLVA